MSFRIIEITDANPEGVMARVSHQDHQLNAILPNKRRDDLAVGTPFEAQIGFDQVLDWKTSEDFEDAKSGIWQEEDGIHLLGRVHSVLDYGDGKTIIDVYMQNGPEVFKIDLDMIDPAELEANSGLEITVGRLYIYPLDH